MLTVLLQDCYPGVRKVAFVALNHGFNWSASLKRKEGKWELKNSWGKDLKRRVCDIIFVVRIRRRWCIIFLVVRIRRRWCIKKVWKNYRWLWFGWILCDGVERTIIIQGGIFFFSERKIEPQLFSDIKNIAGWKMRIWTITTFFQFQHSQIHPVFIAFRTSGRPRLDPVRPGRWRAYLPCCHQVGVIWRWLHRCWVQSFFTMLAIMPIMQATINTRLREELISLR